ncbi:protein-L-isoaspartate(D-aspartate) O-methyltransferase [Paludibaculum fermentans]|uniref:Protein-L-isoaspartate O-methyltransferase n=1 Tax=Paludibaculum fermentans TaxID=1473598 RepID=A0A7S7SMQ1_PALFE|nr:protein-L-isoaspartate(D-aspartate) O-methyltransferase [Paludibaculum fermentans]QOY91537.1 protein-L-isoaspartate(D-aspartate) O-methyltransferase [Paludibaculum fermentans]
MRLWPRHPAEIPPSLPAALEAQDWSALRENMVRTQIERRDVRDPAVLKAMRVIPRHLFVPVELRSSAYEDRPLTIGHGQTISQPYIVGSMSDLLEIQPAHTVLEIGTGCGYQAAILSQLANQVFSVEIVDALAKQSSRMLHELGYRNVTVRRGDGYLGWPEEAPFDRIILTAAPPEMVPALVNQLKNGGRLIAPIGVDNQVLVIVDKDAQGRTQQRTRYGVAFVPMVPGRK